ncbi:AcrR family transcriptional regulator [Kineococcus radiotolerans]|uniref:AcrR family transcriptional regulator n=1 Tax=Kineococcus radiotolerans TaxID=131568 RepID=A0A7W4TNN2_KINRA|nr:TetR/AcrR family transcriptional regulator [Kineococcus radiotolerans]MBB2901631.1 AcrR family transcriptional regulator [Kineococcus radiotolerans]
MERTRRGRPRDPGIDARVLAAAVEELAEKGIAAFSTRGVAARAGVDRRGVHARWAGTEDLVVDALASLTARLEPPLTGSLRGDLEALVPPIAEALSGRRRQVLQRCVDEVATSPAVAARFRRDHVDRCAAVLEDAFHRARTRGELVEATTPARATEVLMGSLLLRSLTLDDPLRGDGGDGGGGGEDGAAERSRRDVLEHVLGLVTRPSPGSRPGEAVPPGG